MKGFKGKIKKKLTIRLVGDAEKAFNDLNKIVGEQRRQGTKIPKGISIILRRVKVRNVLSVTTSSCKKFLYY